jgi:hypothetical protein
MAKGLKFNLRTWHGDIVSGAYCRKEEALADAQRRNYADVLFVTVASVPPVFLAAVDCSGVTYDDAWRRC